MTSKELDIISKRYSEFGLYPIDGYDDCIVGIVERFKMQPVVCYSTDKIIAKLMITMCEEDAWDWFHFNMLGVWEGDGTPCFITHLHP